MNDQQRSAVASWLPLVVDEGQPAQLEGVLIQFGGRYGVVAADGVILTAHDVDVSASPMVELRSADSAIDLANVEGREIVATGTLESQRFAIVGIERLMSQRGSRGAAPRRLAVESVGGQKVESNLRRRPAVERALMRKGLLLDIWREGHGSVLRHVALATDVEEVRSALSAQYGETLDVIQSSWSEGTLREIEAVLDEHGVLWSSGREIDGGSQMRVTATLLHIPSHLARRLQQFPPAALTLQVLVRPAPPTG